MTRCGLLIRNNQLQKWCGVLYVYVCVWAIFLAQTSACTPLMIRHIF